MREASDSPTDRRAMERDRLTMLRTKLHELDVLERQAARVAKERDYVAADVGLLSDLGRKDRRIVTSAPAPKRTAKMKRDLVDGSLSARLVALLGEQQPGALLGVREIAEAAGHDEPSVRSAIWRNVKRGLIEQVGKKFRRTQR